MICNCLEIEEGQRLEVEEGQRLEVEEGGDCWILILWCKKIHVLKLYKTYSCNVDRLYKGDL